MKKMIFGALLALVGTTAFAAVQQAAVVQSSSVTVDFSFKDQPTKVIQVNSDNTGFATKIFVQTNDFVLDQSGYATTPDPLTVTCHGQQVTVNPGSAFICTLSSPNDSMSIEDKAYKNGVDGNYTVLSAAVKTAK